MWLAIASTSVISTIFMPDAHPATILPVFPSLGQLLNYAGLHTNTLTNLIPVIHMIL